MDLNYPHEVDDEEARAAVVRDPNLYAMQPFKDNEVGLNHLIFLAFYQNKFPLYANWPGFYNYYLTIHVHYVKDESGRSVMVACPKKMNGHASFIARTTPVPMPFPAPNDKCQYCAHAQTYWDQYDKLKKAAGLDRMSTEAFRVAMSQHPHIARIRDLAKTWSPKERFFFAVFDAAKATGRKPLEEIDQGSVRIQGYFGPKKIFTDLELKRKAGHKFWDVHEGGYKELIVQRDNSKGARFCNYSMEVAGQAPQLTAEIVEYLKNGDVPDPFQFVQVWPADKMAAYVAGQARAEQEMLATPAQPGAAPAPQGPPPVAAYGVQPPPASATPPGGAAPVMAPPPVMPAAPPPAAAPPPPAAAAAAPPPPPAATPPPPPSAPVGAVAATPPPVAAAAPAIATPPPPPGEAARSKLKWR